ncbi:pectinesterase inhibitor-like [Primulina huaijiensis]|uniref:pectinesterase inhibitor-like n=1 Tax=Primulina huaijiensis TaxID=1492673 RepID=UPI003CC744F5
MAISNKNVALIQQVCEKTHDYSLCVSSLKSDPRGLKADLKDLVVIMMDIALVKSMKILELIIKLKKTASDPLVISSLNVCSSEYGSSMDSLREAIDALESNSYKESYGQLTFAAGGPLSCEDTFAEPPARKSPLTAVNADLYSVVTIAEDILSIVMKHKSL